MFRPRHFAEASANLYDAVTFSQAPASSLLHNAGNAYKIFSSKESIDPALRHVSSGILNVYSHVIESLVKSKPDIMMMDSLIRARKHTGSIQGLIEVLSFGQLLTDERIKGINGPCYEYQLIMRNLFADNDPKLLVIEASKALVGDRSKSVIGTPALTAELFLALSVTGTQRTMTTKH